MQQDEVIEEILGRMTADGFGEGTEPREICKQALQFRNFAYKRSEELETGAVVDCSTSGIGENNHTYSRHDSSGCISEIPIA